MEGGTLTLVVEGLKIVSTALAVMVAIIGHEIMHGAVAYYFGDPTAKEAGRLSINPIVHIDPVGTILVPLLLYISNAGVIFGWAKPVPVNQDAILRKWGEPAAIAVDLAGVLYNFFMAILAALLLKWVLSLQLQGIWGFLIVHFLVSTLLINVVLALFNLLPIPPLDGSNALIHLASWINFTPLVRFYLWIYPYGMVILLLILISPLSHYLLEVPTIFFLQLISSLVNFDLVGLIYYIILERS
ncbi:MAG: site-2 protease family protein [Epsilonproteobacteria bacterium]|nr:site-2 protease family protein [Campylobacterota bacterium]